LSLTCAKKASASEGVEAFIYDQQRLSVQRVIACVASCENQAADEMRDTNIKVVA
jgi:hypothetical protein